MHIDAKADEFLVVVEDSVKVLEEDVAEDVDASVSMLKRILGDGKLADVALVQVGSRTHFEYHFANQERHCLKLARDVVAGLRGRTEGVLAVEFGDSLSPLVRQGRELITGHGEERAARVNDSRILLRLFRVANRFTIV